MYTVSKQGCALLCQTTVSVLCWTRASFCPEFKILKEKTEDRGYLHLPVVTSRSCILVMKYKLLESTRPEIQTSTKGNCSQGSPLAAADTRAHHTCSLPDPADSRLTQALPLLSAFWVSDSSAKQCPRHQLPCLGLCAGAGEHRPDVTCLHCSSQQGQTVSLAPAEEMGKTRSSKH